MFEQFQCHSEEEARLAALQSGGAAVAAQVVLMLTCHYLGTQRAPSLRGKGGFIAHQVIAGVYMVLLFVVGSNQWFTLAPVGTEDAVLAAAERLFSSHATARWCCAVVLGELVLWDIPCALLVPSLQDPLMLGHHVVMALVAYVGAFHLPSAYCLFFFGLVELSSIPLSVVDFFHPQKGLPQLLEHSALLRALNDQARVLFALLFLLVRALYFPYVVAGCLLPDVTAVWGQQERLAQLLVDRMTPLAVIVVSAVCMTLLQLYWAVLIAKQVLKLVMGGEDKNSNKDKRT